MKKIFSALLAVCLMLSLCACTGKADVAPAPTASADAQASPAVSETPAAVFPTDEEQLALIANNRGVWDCSSDIIETDYGFFHYAVTDLDGNGRLEVFAAITQGTGIFTSGKLFEVNERGDGLYEVPFSLGAYSNIPEVIMPTAVKYTDNAKNEIHYIFYDNTRNGAAEFYDTLFEFRLNNGTAEFKHIGSYESIYRNGDSPDEAYYDAAGSELTKDQFYSLSDTVFAGYERGEARFGWFALRDGELTKLLSDSRKVFTGELYEMPAATPAPAPTAEPAPQIPIGESGNISITKNPTSEALSIGGKTWFIAHASGADAITWQFVAPNGSIYSVDDTMAMNPGLSLQVLDGDTIAVDKVPESLNGWGVQAVFSNADYAAATSPAYIYVGDFIGAYDPIIQKYKNALAAGNIDYGKAVEYGISEMVGYGDGAGYALKDLDKDGTPELIVAAIGDNLVYEICTLKGGSPATLCTSQARDRFYLRTDSTVLEISSGGAAYTYYSLYKLGDGAFKQLAALSSDLDDNAAAYWHYTQNGGPEQKLSYDDGCAAADNYQSIIYVPQLTRIK